MSAADELFAAEKLRAALAEAEAVATKAVRLGFAQAKEFDRYWQAAGVLDKSISVDDAIARYQALVQRAEVAEQALLRAGFTHTEGAMCPWKPPVNNAAGDANARWAEAEIRLDREIEAHRQTRDELAELVKLVIPESHHEAALAEPVSWQAEQVRTEIYRLRDRINTLELDQEIEREEFRRQLAEVSARLRAVTEAADAMREWVQSWRELHRGVADALVEKVLRRWDAARSADLPAHSCTSIVPHGSVVIEVAIADASAEPIHLEFDGKPVAKLTPESAARLADNLKAAVIDAARAEGGAK